VLADAHRFGFDNSDEASAYLDALLMRIFNGFDQVVHWLEPEWQELLRARMRENIAILKA
jgi:hypothetical protein